MKAGLVGGCADWFAVTALFRHPFGIPIPHTALLPKNRDKMIRSLVSIIQNEFLTKESIKQKVSDIDYVEKLFLWVEQHRQELVRGTSFLCKQILQHFPFEKVIPVIEHIVEEKLRNIDGSAVLQPILKEVLSKGYDQNALDFILGKIESLVRKEQFRESIPMKIRKHKSPLHKLNKIRKPRTMKRRSCLIKSSLLSFPNNLFYHACSPHKLD